MLNCCCITYPVGFKRLNTSPVYYCTILNLINFNTINVWLPIRFDCKTTTSLVISLNVFLRNSINPARPVFLEVSYLRSVKWCVEAFRFWRTMSKSNTLHEDPRKFMISGHDWSRWFIRLCSYWGTHCERRIRRRPKTNLIVRFQLHAVSAISMIIDCKSIAKTRTSL